MSGCKKEGTKIKKFLVVLLIALIGTTCVFAQEASIVSTASDDLFALIDGTTLTATQMEEAKGGYNFFLEVSNFVTGNKADKPVKGDRTEKTGGEGGYAGHKGTDYDADDHEKYKASKSGVVTKDSSDKDSGVRIVTVKNNDGTISRYEHVDSNFKPGDSVTCGEDMGKVLKKGEAGYGKPGFNSGSHIHYEEYKNDNDFAKRKNEQTSDVEKQW